MREDRIVLAFDLDFADIAAHASGDTHRVVVLRLRNARSDHVVERQRLREKPAWHRGPTLFTIAVLVGNARRLAVIDSIAN